MNLPSDTPFVRWLRLCLVPIACLSIFSAQAGRLPEFSSRGWQVEDGLPHNVVQAMAQTADGYLWAGTQGGLARFDGIRFTLVTIPNYADPEKTFVNCLCAGRDGSLWIGVSGGRLFRLKDGNFISYDQNNGFTNKSDNAVIALYEDTQGTIWIGRRLGAISFRDGKFFETTAKGVANTSVRSIRDDGRGTLWFGTGNGVAQMKDDQVTVFDTRHGLAEKNTRAVYIDHQGSLWVGVSGAVSRFKDGEFVNYAAQHGLLDKTVNAVFESQGTLWIGTYAGLSRWTGEQFVVEKKSDGELYDQVYTMFEDREGNFWVGTKDGLYQFTRRTFESYAQRDGLTHHNIISVLEDKKGTLWVGTWGGGVNKFEDGKFSSLSLAGTVGYAADLILALHEGRDGSLWIGTDYDGGVFRLKEGNVTHFGRAEGLVDNAVRVILEDRHGDVWVGTSTSLNVLRDGKFTRFKKTEGLSGNLIRVLFEDHAGNLWIGTEGGLSRWNNGVFENFETGSMVLSIYEDPGHTLWIGTGQRGLNQFKDGRFIACTKTNGLFSNTIQEILEDDEGRFWISAPNGIFRVPRSEVEECIRGERQTVTCFAYNRADGMPSAVCVTAAKPAGCRTRDGRLWFPTTRGLAVTDPRVGLPKNEVPPPVMIEQIVADKKLIPANATKSGNPHLPTFSLSHLLIPPGRGELEVHYTALSFRAPEKNRFKYKLEGVDSDWVDAGARRIAYYNNLFPGNYTFRVIACNNDGAWNESGASLRITLSPHIWQTDWFRGALVLFLIGSVAGTARYVTRRKMQHKLQTLQRQHALERERSRIAKDIHDEIGAKLTRISLLGGMAKRKLVQNPEVEVQIDKMSGTARELISALDEIVWAVNPQNDTLDNFADYLCRYASECFDNSPILCQLDVPSEVPHRPLTADVRHNLFLAQKEALHNVLKHSCATNVHVQLSIREKEFELTISDNGQGFVEKDESTVDPRTKRTGNGLANMQERLSMIGGRCEIQTRPGQGTRVSFVVNG